MEQIYKPNLSSDCSLQLDYMKLESLVIVDQLCYGEYVPGSCTHRRHTMGVDITRSGEAKLATLHGGISDWGEVVTR